MAKGIPFEEANLVLRAPTSEDAAAGTVYDLHVHRYRDLDGNPNVISKWLFSPDELAQVVAAGGVFWFHAWGHTHPPVGIEGASPFVRASQASAHAPDMPAAAVAAAREAILKSLRDRRLFKYLFAEEPESRAAYGYVDAPIDLETQHECAEDLARLAIGAYLSSQAQPVTDKAEPEDWRSAPAGGLETAIARFKADLPGWWFSVGECQVSCDASCAPTQESEHIALLGTDDRFDSGFSIDLAQPSTLAFALDEVRRQALAAIADAGSCRGD